MALEAYMESHPALHLNLNEFSESSTVDAGWVTLDAKLDLDRLGRAERVVCPAGRCCSTLRGLQCS